MTQEHLTSLRSALIERQDAMAEIWRQAIPRTGYLHLETSDERRIFRDLTHQAILCLTAETFDPQAARSIGGSLAQIRHCQSEALGSAQTVLANLLLEGLSFEQALDLIPGLTALLSELSVGFYEQARTVILQEQEGLRAALATVNARLIQDLQKEVHERVRIEQELREAYDALELRIQERTAEVAQANLALHADIGERLRTEQALRLSNQALKALINAPTDLNVLLDVHGTVLLANDNLAIRLHTTADEMLGKCLWDYFPPHVTEFRRNTLDQVIRTRQPQRVDDNISRAGFFDSLVYPIFNESGEVIQVAILARDISDRLRAEQALRDSEERYHTLIDASPDGIVVTDIEGHIQTANPQFLQLFQVTSIDELHKCYPTSFHLLVEGDRMRAAEAMRQVRNNEPRYSTEFLAQRPDGKTFPVDVRASPLIDNQGRIYGFTTTLRDISQRKIAEDALRASEALYRSLVETSPDGILTTDLEGHILSANQRFLQLVGTQSLEELLSYAANPFDLLVEEDRKLAEDAIQRLFDKGIPGGKDHFLGSEYTLRRLDGTTLPIATNGATVLDDVGQPRGFIVTVRDISKRRADEAARRKNETLLRSIVTNAPVILAVIDPNGVISMIQSQESVALGWDPEAFTGQNIFEDFTFNPAIIHDVKRALSGETVAAIIDTRNGLNYETRYSPIMDETGKVSGIIVVGVNITERYQAEIQLQKAHDELEQRVAERTAELEKANQDLLNEVVLRAQAEERQRHSAERAEALVRMARQMNARLDLQAVLNTICEETDQLLHFPSNSVVLYDEEEDEFSVATSLSPLTPRNFHVPGKVYEQFVRQQDGIIVIEDCQALPEIAGFPIIAETGIRTAISAPLYYTGKLIGAINLISQKLECLPSEEDLSLLKGLADQAAVAIVNARLYEQVSESRQQLRTLSQRLVEAQESERRDLARELHDQFGQALTAMTLELDRLSNIQRALVPHPPEALGKLEAVRTQVSQLLRQVRETSLNLRPALLDDLGLLPALLSYLENHPAKECLQIEFKHSGMDRRFPTQIETAAFRIIQEALTNVVRHAHVQQANVRLWSNPQILGAQIEDQGVGFDVESARRSVRSSGLSGMYERARACGGRLEIESQPGGGTLISAEFPLVEMVGEEGA